MLPQSSRTRSMSVMARPLSLLRGFVAQDFNARATRTVLIVMAKNGSRLTAHWRILVGEYCWPLGGGLLLTLIISAAAWLRTPDMPSYVSLSATRFDLLPLEREELEALPASVRGILLNPDLPEISVSDFAEAARRAEFPPRLPQSNALGQPLPPPKLSVVAPIRTKVTIRVAELH